MAVQTVDYNQRGLVYKTGISAAGTTQADATPIAFNRGTFEISTVGSGQGVVLAPIKLPCTCLIRNAGANSLKVYPHTGDTIDGGSANAPITLISGESVLLWASSATNWYSAAIGSSGGLVTTLNNKTVMGRNSAGTGPAESVTLTQVLDWITTTQGSILYRGASGWTRIVPGTAGKFLKTQGSGADPIWDFGASGLTALTGDVTAAGDGVTTFVGTGQVITASISTQQDDWAPTGLAAANVIRVTNTAAGVVAITGLTGGAEGRILVIQNSPASTGPIKLVSDDGSTSTAANRFLMATTAYLAPGESFPIQYHGGTITRWKSFNTYRDPLATFVGAGTDGDVTVSAPVTLARDMFYKNLTITTGGSILTAGYRIYVSEVLDLSAAPAASIHWNGVDVNAGNNSAGANNASGNTVGGTLTGSTGNSVGGSLNGSAGGAGGSSGAGTNGVAAVSGTTWGGTAKGGGAGGISGTGAGAGTGGGQGVANVNIAINKYQDSLLLGAALIRTGSGAGGGGGGSDTASAGGAGGGGALGGAIVYLMARFIQRGTNTTAGIIQAKGGTGGNGGNGVSGNSGGGGGGSGGPGGAIYLGYGYRLGTAITAALDVSSGPGGNGGNGIGSGAAGSGASSGCGGRVVGINLVTGLVDIAVDKTAATNFNAASGATGGVAYTTGCTPDL